MNQVPAKTAAPDTVARTEATSADPGVRQLCDGLGIEYRAFKRPYDGGPAEVLDLLASCYFGSTGHHLEIEAVPGRQGKYKLFDSVPRVNSPLVSYYAAVYSSGLGLPELGDTITVEDARGEHTVPVHSYATP